MDATPPRRARFSRSRTQERLQRLLVTNAQGAVSYSEQADRFLVLANEASSAYGSIDTLVDVRAAHGVSVSCKSFKRSLAVKTWADVFVF
eukprot:4326906-Karenia_brevis.AAC.1